MRKTILFLLLGSITLFAQEVYATFDVKAKYLANLSPNAEGIIKEIFVDVGKNVKKGERLVRLDNDKQKLALTLAQTTLEKAKISFKNSEKTFQRYSRIRNVIDKEKYDRFTFDRDIKLQDLENAKTNLKLATVRYEDTFVTAPFSGKISEKYFDEGNSVSTKKPILQIVDDSQVKLILEFDEQYWKDVQVGQNFTYKIDGDKEKHVGKITKVYPTANPKNRKIKAEVLADSILVGLFGDGYIDTTNRN